MTAATEVRSTTQAARATLWLRSLAAPVLLLVACLLLWNAVVPDPGLIEGMPGTVGPTGWPHAVLVCLAVLALAWTAREVRVLVRGGGTTAASEPAEPYDNLRAVVGVGIVVLYGGLLPIVGFPLATVALIVVWCLLGRLYRPVVIAATSLLGTAVLLYVFVMLALMPLDRGRGPFDAVTVRLYQLMHIY